METNQQNAKAWDAVSFGEIMLRLTPPNQERTAWGDSFIKSAGGAELNVMAGMARLGSRTAILSKFPDNALTQFIRKEIRACGVSDQYLTYDRSGDARLGVYFYEQGALPRKPSVVYDRKGSSVNRAEAGEFDPSIFGSTRLFHLSGISLAISQQARAASTELMKRFRQAGALISFDVNYRANLWSEEEAYDAIRGILPLVDILFISEETSRRMFRKTGELEEIMASYCREYGVSVVATTRRKAVTPTCHNFGSVIYEAKTRQFYTEPDYEGIQVIDRVGSGDAYVAGALWGLLEGSCQKAVACGNAMAALKSTVFGDLPQTDLSEVEKIIAAHRAEGPQSEMER